MILQNVKNAEITFKLTNGNEVHLPLSKTQIAVIVKLLGVDHGNNFDEVVCFSDDTLQQLASMKGNPLRIKPIDKN